MGEEPQRPYDHEVVFRDEIEARKERDARIYQRRLDGLSYAALGREFGLSSSHIQTIVRRQYYRSERAKKLSN